MATRRPPSTPANDRNGPPRGDAYEPDRADPGDFDPAAEEMAEAAEAAGEHAEAPDPFNPAALRLQGHATVAVKKALLVVPVRKPDKAWFVRVHPDPAYHLETYLIELKEDRESYLIAPPLWPELMGEVTFTPSALFTAVNRQGTPFLWPIRLPGPDGKDNEWNRTAREAAVLARKGWCRVTANMSLGGYDVFQAPGQIAEPEWPELPLGELLRVAFRDRFIDSLDHPVLRKLRGEV